jgi:hypothetical protein
MPFPSYDEGDIAQFAADDKYYASVLEQQRQLRQPVTDPLDVAPQVAKLEHGYRKCKSLCAEILASLTLKGNAHWFEGFPDDWWMRVEAWQARLKALEE